jgi:programmed cell death protein 4
MSSSSAVLEDAAKKGGKGGKGTWLGAGDVLADEVAAVADASHKDPKSDPINYDSEDDKDDSSSSKKGNGRTENKTAAGLTVADKTPEELMVREFFVQADLEDLEIELHEMTKAGRVSPTTFVRKCFSLAMESSAFERELVSDMAAQLCGRELSQDTFIEGFQDTLDCLDDLVIDTPNAPEVLAKFLARATSDEVVPPSALDTFKPAGDHAHSCMSLTRGLLSEKHSAQRLAHIWGPGDHTSVKRMKESVKLMLREYLEETQGDREEVARSIKELNAPAFHFHIVKAALELPFELAKTADEAKSRVLQICDLIQYLHSCGVLASEHVQKGWKIVFTRVEDYVLDAPIARSVVEMEEAELRTLKVPIDE